jgi:ParB family transcriptional regulator, chromosome partitioning protein
MKRDRLGKGLGALLGEYLPAMRAQARPGQGPHPGDRRISPNPYQPRREFSEEELADLTASLRENGLLQPILVRPAPEPGRCEVGAGGRGAPLARQHAAGLEGDPGRRAGGG